MSQVLVLTGAGISAESGIKTFRDTNGLWENHRVEDVASPQGFKSDPAMVWDFYKKRYAQSLEAEPNRAHQAWLTWRESWGIGFISSPRMWMDCIVGPGTNGFTRCMVGWIPAIARLVVPDSK